MKQKARISTVQQSHVAISRHIDDNTINDHIRRIMTQRVAISQLADKYGLDDIHKVERLSLLTVPN
jgi:hypothetical protein